MWYATVRAKFHLYRGNVSPLYGAKNLFLDLWVKTIPWLRFAQTRRSVLALSDLTNWSIKKVMQADQTRVVNTDQSDFTRIIWNLYQNNIQYKAALCGYRSYCSFVKNETDILIKRLSQYIMQFSFAAHSYYI